MGFERRTAAQQRPKKAVQFAAQFFFHEYLWGRYRACHFHDTGKTLFIGSRKRDKEVSSMY